MAQWADAPAGLHGGSGAIPSPGQWGKDPAFLQLWRKSQLPLELDPWPGNFHVLGTRETTGRHVSLFAVLSFRYIERLWEALGETLSVVTSKKCRRC